MSRRTKQICYKICYSKTGPKNWGKKRKKKEYTTVINEEIPQEEQQPGPSWQCNNLAESLNDETSDKEKDDGATCKICKIPRIELMEKCEDWVQYDLCHEYIYPKCYDKSDFSTNDDFL